MCCGHAAGPSARRLMTVTGCSSECAGEEEAQCRGLPIHLRWLRTTLDLRKLEATDVVAGRSIERAAEKSGKSLNIPDIVALHLIAERPDGHVRDHAVS